MAPNRGSVGQVTHLSLSPARNWIIVGFADGPRGLRGCRRWRAGAGGAGSWHVGHPVDNDKLTSPVYSILFSSFSVVNQHPQVLTLL